MSPNSCNSGVLRFQTMFFPHPCCSVDKRKAMNHYNDQSTAPRRAGLLSVLAGVGVSPFYFFTSDNNLCAQSLTASRSAGG
ncbi:hypothetical protein BCF11_2290 [Collimonas sp. PA-H2]|nr:hypothetical protein BCF11_2290 [Collimonas sp. PA-H2]